MEELAPAPIEREEIDVIFLRIHDDVDEMKAAWEKLE